MKKLKFFLAAIVALLVTFVGGKAYAYTITINGETDGHTFEAYQIFKGDLNDSTLSNIQWGTGVTPFEFHGSNEAAKIAEGLTESNAVEFSKEAAKHLTSNPSATGTSTITVTEAGYYLIKDKDNSLTGKDGKAYTAYILKVIKDETVKPKADVPSVIKKVKDTNDTTGETTDWQDSADYDFGDKVPFQLTATLPKTNFDKYQTYYLEFSDTLSKGLSYDENSLVVKVGDRTLTTSEYTISTTKDSEGNTKLSVVITDVKALGGTAGGKVTVDYTATLTTDAVIGAKGNPNEVELIYSNNPNENGTGKPKDTGKTPKDTVIVFTYKTVVNKVDQNKQPLTGAGFTLYKKVKGEWKVVKEITAGEATKFEFTGIDDGEYKLSETATPAGYNTIKDITFTVEATHETEADQPKLTNLSGVAASGQITFTADKDAGSLTTQVENKKGSILPSTGSIGTTVLYVAGSVLVVAAGILLVTKKRMKN
ncbi:fimbrial protein [Streptococcus oralis subsp. tigurinus]|uniref:Fimbrial protein n=1 Tax=Streptococcus oralis subsp. tigurinus TaxID=1077464 RepID=A0A1X0WXV8_STROR|nr:isopeptide-forming domain-containing fimbrial protein [Streptococcus oralis]ORJ31613.1 fimbrial protein [Streptococcus oralis subsp. tigurinus]